MIVIYLELQPSHAIFCYLPEQDAEEQPLFDQSRESLNSNLCLYMQVPSVDHCTFPRFYGMKTQIF